MITFKEFLANQPITISEFLNEETLAADIAIPADMGPPMKKKKGDPEVERPGMIEPSGTFGDGTDVFDVDISTFMKCKDGRAPRKWWTTFTGIKGIKEYMGANPKRGIMLRHKGHHIKVK